MICPQCEREVIVELVRGFGPLELVEDAATIEEGWRSTGDFQATVRASCSCDYVDLEATDLSTNKFDVPDEWVEAVASDD